MGNFRCCCKCETFNLSLLVNENTNRKPTQSSSIKKRHERTSSRKKGCEHIISVIGIGTTQKFDGQIPIHGGVRGITSGNQGKLRTDPQNRKEKNIGTI